MQKDGFFDYEQADTIVSTSSPTRLRREHPCTCARTPDDRQTWVLRPEDLIDVLRTANRLWQGGQTQCLLLDLPENPVNLTPCDLRQWAETVAKRVDFPVIRCVEGERFPCGKKAYCEHHAASIARETQAQFTECLERKQTLDGAIGVAFSALSERNQQIVRQWAVEEDPKKSGRAITLATLGKRFKLSSRQIQRILEKAEDVNKHVFQQLEMNRKVRFRRTGAYEVRD
ncbi:MAG: hypothetical protein IJV69_04955 [Kiritimatiellae bacterium]|nr:hypothetical protein [Kiritimatiellia bacterium]